MRFFFSSRRRHTRLTCDWSSDVCSSDLAFLKLLLPLLDSGVVCWQRCGVGRRLVVNDADTLRDFYRQRFPNAALPSGAGSRVASVGRFRDTKALTNSEGEIISLRVWQNEALLKNGKPFDAAPLTVAHGVFS